MAGQPSAGQTESHGSAIRSPPTLVIDEPLVDQPLNEELAATNEGLHLMTEDVVDLLAQLVAIPSVNPMGRDVKGPPFFEQRLTEFLCRWFDRLGVPWETQEVAPQRHNVVACLPGRQPLDAGGRLWVWQAHQDTVPVDGMTFDPFELTRTDGHLYGRGACDVKGGMAAMLTAFAQVAQSPTTPDSTLIIACTVNEENGFTGSRALAQRWAAGRSRLVPRTPDAVIVAEPTDLNIVVAHKGVVRWRCHTRGRAAHSSVPDQGDNAIYRMAKILTQLQDYADHLHQQSGDVALGPATMNVGTIHGGLCANAVPDGCTIEIDRRLLPGEEPLAARQSVIDHLAAHGLTGGPIEHEPPFLWSPGLSDQSGTSLAQTLSATLQAGGIPARQIAVPFGTDAPSFAGQGSETVVFGPGSIKQAHTVDEWIAEESLQRCVHVLRAHAANNAV